VTATILTARVHHHIVFDILFAHVASSKDTYSSRDMGNMDMGMLSRAIFTGRLELAMIGLDRLSASNVVSIHSSIHLILSMATVMDRGSIMRLLLNHSAKLESSMSIAECSNPWQPRVS
jgi:hypothetical protein